MSNPHLQPSFTQHFIPPKGMEGHAGWVCGYSADDDCLEPLLLAFTGQNPRQRAREGRTYISLCLDRSHAQIAPGTVHGLHHLPSLNRSSSYLLMHAKVALLSFRDRDDSENWLLRLLVTTGNWTRQTMSDSIDLIWGLDLAATDLKRADDLVLADMAAARDFWRWLRQHYQWRLPGAQDARFKAMDEWLDKVRRPAGSTPRFFDTRSQSLIAQLPQRVEALAGRKPRNRLFLGSGFWEGGGSAGLPQVPQKIIKALDKGGLLAGKRDITLVVQPDNCAALANEEAFASMQQARWTLLPPPRNDQRGLHAKFLFSANKSPGNASAAAAWVYLGSGNMTPAGFLNAAGPGGNLEAGIVMRVDKLQWDGVAPQVGQMLPIDLAGKPIGTSSVLEEGSELPVPDGFFVAAPVSYLVWDDSGSANILKCPPDQPVPGLIIIGPDGQPVIPDAEGHFPWPAAQPAHVGVRPDADTPAIQVPVLDALNRLAARQLEPIDLEKALGLLGSFPQMPAGDDDDEDEDDAPDKPRGGDNQNRGRHKPAPVPIRGIMKLVEQIAERQTAVPSADWLHWTLRLKMTLIQLGALPGARPGDAAGLRTSDLVNAVVHLQVNPLRCLREPPFLPDYVRPGAPEFQALDAVLDEVEDNWGVTTFRGFAGEGDHGA